MLPQSEIDAIKQEALTRFPTSNAEWVENQHINYREIYVDVTIKEIQRAKVLCEGLEKIRDSRFFSHADICSFVNQLLDTYNKNKP